MRSRCTSCSILYRHQLVSERQLYLRIEHTLYVRIETPCAASDRLLRDGGRPCGRDRQGGGGGRRSHRIAALIEVAVSVIDALLFGVDGVLDASALVGTADVDASRSGIVVALDDEGTEDVASTWPEAIRIS